MVPPDVVALAGISDVDRFKQPDHKVASGLDVQGEDVGDVGLGLGERAFSP